MRTKAKLEQDRAGARAEAERAEREAASFRSSAVKAHHAAVRVQQERADARDRKKLRALRRVDDLDRQIEIKAREIARLQEHLDDLRRREREDAERRRWRDELEHEQRLTREAALRASLFSPGVTSAAYEALPERIIVLFAAANPADTTTLALDEEIREVNARLQASRHRDAIDLRSAWALRPLDLLSELSRHRPRVLHFSGHGSATGDLVLSDEHRRSKAVTPEAITAALATTDDIRLVVFNVCVSAALAQGVVEHVDTAIGMTQPVGDHAAQVFAGQLYSSIGDGYSVARAFKRARAALMLESIPEENTPALYARDGVDPDEVLLLAPSGPAPV